MEEKKEGGLEFIWGGGYTWGYRWACSGDKPVVMLQQALLSFIQRLSFRVSFSVCLSVN